MAQVYRATLRADDGSVLHSPFMHGIVTFIFLGGLLAGLAYGFGAEPKPDLNERPNVQEELDPIVPWSEDAGE